MSKNNIIEELRNVEIPVSDAEWNSILSDSRVQAKFVKPRKMRRLAIYSSAVVAVAAVAVAVALFAAKNDASQPNPESVAQNDNSLSQGNVFTSAQDTATVSKSNNNAEISDKIEPEDYPISYPLASSDYVQDYILGQMPESDAISIPDAQISTKKLESKPEIGQVSLSFVDDFNRNADNRNASDETNAKFGVGGCVVDLDDILSEDETPEEEIPEENVQNWFIPSAFTPNGDGLNDVFYVKADFEPSDFEMFIVSRNGDMIFHSRDMQFGWDGKANGATLPQGVYVYIIKYKDVKGKEIKKQGQVLLLN